jgi:hypothetical protein
MFNHFNARADFTGPLIEIGKNLGQFGRHGKLK